jgi:SAM-dependent methyltransferase
VSHPEQLGFFACVANSNHDLIDGSSVLEIGSYDVNGSVRSLFGAAGTYTGVDLVEGPGVDVVAYGHELDCADGSYDIAVSGECFEHDPHWRDTFRNMVRVTRPGGLVAFTCASVGRPEHGTRRTKPQDSPGTQSEDLDYYRNLTSGDFEDSLPLDEWFSEYRFWYLSTSFDLYFAGVRAGSVSDSTVARLPDPDEVETLHKLMTPLHRMLRLPLRALVPLLSEERYQRVVLPYWLTLLRASERLPSRSPKRGS